MSETTTNVVEWLKMHWFLLTALVAIGIAWGTAISQVKALENDVSQLKIEKEYVQELGRAAERLDERTLLMQHSLQRQEAILIQLLQSQRRLESATTMRTE